MSILNDAHAVADEQTPTTVIANRREVGTRDRQGRATFVGV